MDEAAKFIQTPTDPNRRPSVSFRMEVDNEKEMEEHNEESEERRRQIRIIHI